MSDVKTRVMQAMRDLPPLPTVVQKLLAVMNDEDSSADDVTRVLSSDQALAGKILKLVNSSYYGMSGEVATITRAVVVLGFSGVRNTAMGFGMVSALKKLGGGLDMQDFWDHAIATGAGAQAMAEELPQLKADPEEAFIAGLMHDIGHIVLAGAAPAAYAAARGRADGGEDALVAEKAELTMTHAAVGERLLRFWQLPPTLQAAARYHHAIKVAASREQPLTTLVTLGDVLACIHGGAFERPLGEADLSRLLRLWGLEPAQVHAALGRMDGKIEEMRVFLKIADEGDGVAEGAAPAAVHFPVVLISTDPERLAWVGGLLDRLGHPRIELRRYLECREAQREVGLVILDPGALTREQLRKLVPFLDAQDAATCVLGEPEVGSLTAELAGHYPGLPYVFSRNDLQRLASLQAV